MYQTVEVRWFYKGKIPEKILSDKDVGGSRVEPEFPRIDYYYSFGNKGNIGIKVREGRLEVKYQTKTFGAVQFLPHVTGLVNSWTKWGLNLYKSDGKLNNRISNSKRWVGIRKTRWIQRYKFGDFGEIIIVPQNSDPTNGCDWEISEVELLETEDEWWSVAFECFGKDVSVEELYLVVNDVLKENSCSDFLLDNSMGYPMWLKTLV